MLAVLLIKPEYNSYINIFSKNCCPSFRRTGILMWLCVYSLFNMEVLGAMF